MLLMRRSVEGMDVWMARASYADMDEVCGLLRECFPDKQFEKQKFFMDMDCTYCIFSKKGALATVSITYGHEVPDVARLHWLAVKPSARGNGYSHRLVEQVLNDAARAGMRSVDVKLNPVNEIAEGLYAQHGFSAVREDTKV